MLKTIFKYMNALRKNPDEYNLEDFDAKAIEEAHSIIYHIESKLR